MKRNLFLALILILILVSACAPAPTATPTPLKPTAAPPTATLAATDVPPTATITPTSTDVPPTPTDSPTAAPTATTAPIAKCVYSATVVSEDPQDNQQLAASESFTKTWTLKNSGNCAWDGTGWKLTAANAPGDTMLSDDNEYRMDDLSNPKKNIVIAGDSISVSLNMKAPDHWGTFTQNWQFIDSYTNQIMAITNGSSGQTFYARIVVPDSSDGSSSGSQKPTVEIQNIALQDGAVACTTDASYDIVAKIIGKANVQVSYTVSTDSNGTPLDAGATVTLNKKGGYDINTAITGPYSDPENLQITITVFLDGTAVNYTSGSICQDGAYQQ